MQSVLFWKTNKYRYVHFFIPIEEFYPLESKKKILKKFLDSEFVKTCHEDVIRLYFSKYFGISGANFWSAENQDSGKNLAAMF